MNSVRLDQYVTNRLGNFISRSLVAKLIEQGHVKVNHEPITKVSYKLKTDDKVIIDYNFSQNPARAVKVPVIYEDEDCVVINKPVGLLTHSKGAFNPEPTVASWLASHLQDISGERAGIVHRLDRATSGLMICAKNSVSMRWLQKQFASRRVTKTYKAIISGHLKNNQAVIDMPIERNPKKPQSFRVGINGKRAVTNYKVLATSDKYSLLELKPLTGRTHQLRVHLKQLGHPIVGDQLYGGEPCERLLLHAASLDLNLLSGEHHIFKARLPIAFNKLLKS